MIMFCSMTSMLFLKYLGLTTKTLKIHVNNEHHLFASIKSLLILRLCLFMFKEIEILHKLTLLFFSTPKSSCRLFLFTR